MHQVNPSKGKKSSRMEKVPKRLRRSDSFFRGLEKPFVGYKAWPPIDVTEEENEMTVRDEVTG